MKEIEKVTHKIWTISHVHELKVLIFFKMSTLPKVMCRFNSIPIKTPMELFKETEKNTAIIYMVPQKDPIYLKQSSKKNKINSVKCLASRDITRL
jgi:hypothetical protein